MFFALRVKAADIFCLASSAASDLLSRIKVMMKKKDVSTWVESKSGANHATYPLFPPPQHELKQKYFSSLKIPPDDAAIIKKVYRVRD